MTPTLRILRVYLKRWLVPALVATALAGAYALVRPATWEASQALTVRNEATNTPDAPGRFAQPDEMKTVQETILELVKSRGVLSAALEQVGPPADRPDALAVAASSCQPDQHPCPNADDIAELRDAIKLVPPKGAEFGKTEVFYLKVRDRDPQRAIALAAAICRQLEAAIEKVRDAKARSMVRELAKAVEVADADLAQSTERLGTIERHVGSDLAELRLLCESTPGESALGRSVAEIRAELRQLRALQKSNEQLLALLKEAQTEPERLVATPNTLLDSQPAMKKLKDGLIEAQLNTAQLKGRMSDAHPFVIAARESQAEIRNRLHEEIEGAIRAVEADLRLGVEKAALLEWQLAALEGRLDVLAALRAPYANQLAQTRKCSDLLDRAQQRLADARASHATAGAASLISAIDGPDAGTQPIGPGRATIVLLGMVGGVLAGFGVLLLSVDPAACATVCATASQKPCSTTVGNTTSTKPWHTVNGNGHRRSSSTQHKASVEAALKTLSLGGRRTDF